MKNLVPIVLLGIWMISVCGSGSSELPSNPACVGSATEWSYAATSEDLENTCSLGCALGWIVSASSELDGHPVKALDDHSIDSSWISDDQKNPRVYFSFPKENFPDGYSEIRFDGFYLVSGFGGGSTYARPRIVKIFLNNKFLCQVTAIDTFVPQSLSIPDAYLRPGDVLTVEIDDVYPGSETGRPAIAALIPTGAH